MDVGSTKRDVSTPRRALREHIGSFVPAHPVAGKEGFRHQQCRRGADAGARSS